MTGSIMVIRIATNGDEVLDLANPADNFGAGDDVVIVRRGWFIANPFEFAAVVNTYEGDDVIVIDGGNSMSGFIAAGSGDDIMVGGEGNDYFLGGLGDDHVSGGFGVDEFYFGRGYDTYDGGSGPDTMFFGYFYGEGNHDERLTLAIECRLDRGWYTVGDNGGQLSSIENVLAGDGDDRIIGNDRRNELWGYDGEDYLVGRRGHDRIKAQDGADTLVGGRGRDYIDLGEVVASRDVVAYRSVSDSFPGYRDRISYFDSGGGRTNDKIDLSAIDARPDVAGDQAFRFRDAFTGHPGEVVFVSEGSEVRGDLDGDQTAELSFFVDGVVGLSAIDFVL
jgi:Ca2+-binding RTX toxin-like protein